MTTIYLIPNVLGQETSHKTVPPYNREIIRQLGHFFVEDIRTARRFISSLGLNIEIDKLVFFELDKNTEPQEVSKNIAFLVRNNLSAGMISEAGCPCVADPGNILVHLAHKQDIKVEPLVGASSILLALIGSGLNGQQFAFHGYLPIEEDKKTALLKVLEKESKQKRQTQIFMETPYRNNALFDNLLHCLQPETLLCIASELTSASEYIKTQKIKDWQKNMVDLHKKPTIFLIQAN